MEQSILNSFQKKVLSLFAKTSLTKKYYLSGGTALAEYYLHHRRSEDLDFFTEQELDLDELKRFILIIKRNSKIDKVEFQHGFGLYTFFLIGAGDSSKNKIDFGQYPFSPIEKPKSINGISVESLYDIAVNKAQTIAFRPRLRDFIDLYCILRVEKQWNFQELLHRSFEKFEMKADALQIGENLLLVKSLKDMPIMVKKINLRDVEAFFIREAGKLKKAIWSDSR